MAAIAAAAVAATRNVQLNAVLTDTGGNPIAAKTVTFGTRVTGSATFTSAGSATTDAAGKASVVTSVTVPSSIDAQANFAGDSSYDASTATVTGFAVKAGSSMALTIVPQ